MQIANEHHQIPLLDLELGLYDAGSWTDLNFDVYPSNGSRGRPPSPFYKYHDEGRQSDAINDGVKISKGFHSCKYFQTLSGDKQFGLCKRLSEWSKQSSN